MLQANDKDRRIARAQTQIMPKAHLPILRSELKESTRYLHDQLDKIMGNLALGETAQFGLFLQVQYAARAEIETWLKRRSSSHSLPPMQCELLSKDLALIELEPWEPIAFEPSPDAATIGMFWALSGSSLGNQMILRKRQKSGLFTPPHFLSNAAMPRYFSQLRGELEKHVDRVHTKAAIAGATAIFDSFLMASERLKVKA